jgi:low affinity Fe/Cu permease
MAIDREIRSIVSMHRSNAITIEGSVEERIEQVKNIIAQYV